MVLAANGSAMEGELEINPAARDAAPPDRAVRRPEHAEGSVTRLLEQQTAKISSDLFLAAALMSMVTSLTCELTGRRRASRFIGMWPGPLLVMGVYNKLVKLLGPR
jgi:hypothetical protein